MKLFISNPKKSKAQAMVACGRGALASVMVAAKALGANQAKILNYATSGDVTGDFSQVVGYGAAVFLKSANPVVSSN